MSSKLLLIFFAFSVSVVCSSRTLGPSPDNPPTEIYIVHADSQLYHGDCKQYQQLLDKVILERSPKDALVFCLDEVMRGFAAKLTEEEAEKLKGEKGIYGVYEEKKYSVDAGRYINKIPIEIHN